MRIGKRIGYFRKKSGFTQEEFACALDVSRQSVYKWEADISCPSYEKLDKIIKLLNITYDDLFIEKGEK